MHSQVYPANNSYLLNPTTFNRQIDSNHSSRVCQTSIPYHTDTELMTASCYTDHFYMNSILFTQTTTNKLHESINTYDPYFHKQHECVKCGAATSAQNTHWRTDTSGFNLCHKCEIYAITNRKNISSDCQCVNCFTTDTTLWRRNSSGESVCNACGLYYKLHGINRPWSLKKNGIQTRKRKSKKDKSSKMNDMNDIPEYHQQSSHKKYSPARISDSLLFSYESSNLHPHFSNNPDSSSSSIRHHPSQYNYQQSQSQHYLGHSDFFNKVKNETQ